MLHLQVGKKRCEQSYAKTSTGVLREGHIFLHRLQGLISQVNMLMLGRIVNSKIETHSWCMQVEVMDAEAYRYDGEVMAKAKALGKEGIVSITPRQVSAYSSSTWRIHVWQASQPAALYQTQSTCTAQLVSLYKRLLDTSKTQPMV